MKSNSSHRSRTAAGLALVCISALALLSVHAAVPQNPDSQRQRIDRVEAGLQAEECIRAVKRLQHTFSHYLESGLWADLGDLFTDDVDGQFQGATIIGKANLRKHFMDEAGRAAPGLAEGQLNAHLILQPIVTLGADGKIAKGAWHEFAMLGQFGSSASWRGGIYENEYKLDKGVWKISRLRFFEQYRGAYEEFGHKAPARWDIPYHFEAQHVGLTIPPSALAALAATPSNTAAGTRLAQLTERAQRLSDETDVENLQHSYGYYLDRKLWDDAADLFSDDGSLELKQRGTYTSKPHIRRALEAIYGAAPLHYGELFDHINLATVVTIAADGQSAAARTAQLNMIGRNGEFAQWEEGVYENAFIRQGGVWKIKAVHYYPRMTTDYYKGWATDAAPAPAANTEVPPDRPSAGTYAAYPKTQYIGFHYANPVTGRALQYPSGTVAQTPVVTPANGSAKTAPVDNAKLDAALGALERKVDAAIAVDAVENLNSSYGYYLDESAWDNMADTFAVTAGAKEITGAGTYVGRERIREVLNLRGPRGGRSATTFTIHQLTQPVIHISEDGLSAKARLRLFQCGGGANGSSGSWIGGIYENTAVKENGEWKFGVQDLHHIFNASYRNGWARYNAAPAARGAAQAGATPTARGAAPAARGAQPGGAPVARGATQVGPTPPPRGAAPVARGAQPAGAPAARGAAQVGTTPPAGGAAPAARGGGLQEGIGGAAPASRITTQLPPDRPIRSRQYAFPEIVEPAFHYRNPVTGRMPAELLP